MRQRVLGGLAILAIGGAAVSLLSDGEIDRDRETLRLHEDCGATLAALTHDALQNGKRVLVLEHTGSGLNPEKSAWMHSQIQSFYANLKSSVKVTKQPVNSEESDRMLEARERTADPRFMRQAGYEPFRTDPPEADVIVSFVGEPMLPNGRGVEAWTHLPPVVCFSLSGEDVRALMEAGVVVAAVAPRSRPIAIKDAKKKSWFEIMYEVVTPKNLGDWAPLQPLEG